MKQLLFLFSTAFLMQCIVAQEVKSYSKFDFMPGSEIVYFNDFEGEAKGELPAGWNTNGSGEIVTMAGLSWIKLLQNATFITDNSQSFSAHFTVEFDMIIDFKGTDALFPQVSFGVLASGANSPNSNAILQDMFQNQLVALDLNTGIENNSFTRLVSFNNEREYFNSGEKPYKQLETLVGKGIHISMQLQQQRFRVWVNETKLFDVPNALPERTSINQLFFRVFESSYSNEQIGVYVSNIKVAKGMADAGNKLLTEGKFVTHGIYFKTGSAEIKPESYAVLKEVATVLKDSPALKVLIIGHTDSDGSDAENLFLSKKRSTAVKQFLVTEFGLDSDRLSADGKGELQPVVPNTTREGKSQNRRVEFVRQ